MIWRILKFIACIGGLSMLLSSSAASINISARQTSIIQAPILLSAAQLQEKAAAITVKILSTDFLGSGNSDQSSEGTIAYVAGFPKAKAASISSSIYNFTDGKITANASRPLKDGYALVYSNITLPGMSGGPVFNEQGELIGVHDRGDESEADIATSKINPEVAYIKSGFNLGIPINTFLRLSAKSGIDFGVSPPPERVSTAPKADDFLIQGVDKRRKGDNRGAIDDYNLAIKINPKFAYAYYNRGMVRSELGDKQGAIDDYNLAIKINPNFADAYYNRGNARSALGDNFQAISDFQEAAKLYQQQGKDEDYQDALNRIRELQQ